MLLLAHASSRFLPRGTRDISASQYCYHDRGATHEFQLRAESFYKTEQWYRSPDLRLSAAGATPRLTSLSPQSEFAF